MNMTRRDVGYLPNNGKCQGKGCGALMPHAFTTKPKPNGWHIFYSSAGKDHDVILCPACNLKTKIKK